MLRFIVLAAACLSVSSCGLTKVSDSMHERDVRKMNVAGLSVEEARAMATRNGFKCDTGTERATVRTKEGVTRKADILDCHKTSIDLICPQRRYVNFDADPQTGNVFNIGRRIVEHSCF